MAILPPLSAAVKEILQTLAKYKHQIAIGIAVTALIAVLAYLVPGFRALLVFFLPLLLAVVAIFVFFYKAPVPVAGEPDWVNAVQGLFDYIVDYNDPLLQNYKTEL